MSKAKNTIGIGIIVIIAVSVWMSFVSSPINGIAFFFVLTCLLWAIAKIKRWI